MLLNFPLDSMVGYKRDLNQINFKAFLIIRRAAMERYGQDRRRIERSARLARKIST